MLLHLVILGFAFAWVAILVSAWLGWQLLRQNGRLLLRLEALEQRLNDLEFSEDQEPAGLPVGAEAPAFELPDLAGGLKSLAQYRGRPSLLVFFDPECGYCRDLVPKLAAVRESEAGGHRAHLLIVTKGEAEKNRQLFAGQNVRCPVLLQNDAEVATAFQAYGTPSGYLIDADGKLASELTVGGEALLALASTELSHHPVSRYEPTGPSGGAHSAPNGREQRFRSRSLARSKIQREGLRAGTQAPEFRLPRLDGKGDLALSELRGKRVLLVFSSPNCGPCLELAPDLEDFHLQHPDVELVMISKGQPKENRAKAKEYGLTFPIVLQQQWEISRLYAMFATPIAYLIDEHGVIQTGVAVGTDQIRNLLKSQSDNALRENLVLA